MTEQLHFHFSLSCIGEGNGNPLQCSCLENPRDEGARWAAIYGVAQSRTRLKRCSSSSKSTKSSKDIKEERQKPKEKKWKLFSFEMRRHKMRISLFFSFSLSHWLLFRLALEKVTETLGDGEHKLCNQQFKSIKSTSVPGQPSVEKKDQT